jgi:hypothetical protein
MTEERLKGSVSVRRQVPFAGVRYSNIGLEFSEEFILGERTHEGVTDELLQKLRDKMIAMGLVEDTRHKQLDLE